MTITLRRRPLTLALLLVLPPTSVPRSPIDSAMPVVPPTDTTDVVPNTETSVPALANIDLQFRHCRQAVLGHLIRLAEVRLTGLYGLHGGGAESAARADRRTRAANWSGTR